MKVLHEVEGAMKVYLLIENCSYDNEAVVDVFSTRAKLVAYFNTNISHDSDRPLEEQDDYYGEYAIKEVEVQ